MFDDGGEQVRLDVVVVGVGAVELRRVDHRGVAEERARRIGAAVAGQADGGHAAVGQVVLPHVQEVEVDAGRCLQPERQRRGDAPAVVLDPVASRHAAVLAHRVEAERGVLAQRLVPVGGGAPVPAAAVTDRAGNAVAQLRLLADQVHRTGRRGAAVVGAGRALGHFHLLDVEHVARDRAEVAHAVDEDAAGGVEAAHVDAVAGAGVAVLAHIERAHARAVAQRLGQRGGALLLDQLLGDHADGLRGVQQRLGEFRRGQLVDAVVVAGDGFHLHARQVLGGGDLGVGGR